MFVCLCVCGLVVLSTATKINITPEGLLWLHVIYRLCERASVVVESHTASRLKGNQYEWLLTF